MKDLALQVADVNRVTVADAERAHAGRGQIKDYGRAQAARAHHEHARGRELALPGLAHLGQAELAGVALALFAGQFSHGIIIWIPRRKVNRNPRR